MSNKPQEAEWIKEPAYPSTKVFGPEPHEHLGGVPWFEAPIPRKLHRCKPQTRGYINYFTLIERCACGAIRMDDQDPWTDRNSAKRPRDVPAESYNSRKQKEIDNHIALEQGIRARIKKIQEDNS